MERKSLRTFLRRAVRDLIVCGLIGVAVFVLLRVFA